MGVERITWLLALVLAIVLSPLEAKAKWLYSILAILLYQNMALLASLWRYRDIPGPLPLPVVGNLLSLVMNPNIHEVYSDWEAKFGKKFKWFMGTGVVIVLSDVELVREVGLRKFSNFMNHMNVPDKLLPLLPEELKAMSKYSMDVSRDMYWKGLRSTANSIFHNVQVLSSFCPLMKETASELVLKLGQVGEGQSIDIWRALGDMTLDVIGSTVFGVRFNCIQTKGADAVKAARIIFRQNIVSFSWNPYLALGLLAPKFMIPPLESLSKVFPTSAMKEVEWAVNVLAKLSDEMVENANQQALDKEEDSKTNSGSNNFLKLFIQAHNRETGKLLSKDEVKAQALLYLLAGYETTANTLAYSIYLLSKNKDKEQALIDEINRLEEEGNSDLKSYVYVEATVREALRMFGPIPFTDRQASDEQQLTDFKVVKGQVIHIATRNMHYNPEYFPEPDKFIPERFLKTSSHYNHQNHRAFMAWGLGPRMCVAADFALNEAKLALITLYQNFHFEHNEDVPLKLAMGASLGPVSGVEVFVHKR